MKKYLLLVTLLIFSLTSMAQVETSPPDSLVTMEENVLIFKDTRLDLLNKRPALMAKVEEEKEKDKIVNYNPIVSADGKKKVTGSIYTSKGFRIIIYNGPDRNAAMLAKNNFTRAFPGVASYVSYNVPSYKIKVGNFESRNEASAFMRKVNKAFPTAFIVPDIVTIKNINVVN